MVSNITLDITSEPINITSEPLTKCIYITITIFILEPVAVQYIDL